MGDLNRKEPDSLPELQTLLYFPNVDVIRISISFKLFIQPLYHHLRYMAQHSIFFIPMPFAFTSLAASIHASLHPVEYSVQSYQMLFIKVCFCHIWIYIFIF